MRLAPPDHERELVKGRGDGHSGKCIVPEFVVSSLQVLDEGMAFDDHAGGPVLFEAPHGAKPGLQASVVSFDPIVGILSGVVKCGRQEFRNDSDQGVGSIGGDFSRLAVGGDRTGKERCRSLQVTLLGQEHVDDLSVLVNCSVDVPPRPGDLHVGLVDEPVTTDAVATRPGRVHQQRREPLDPSIQGHMVDVDTPLGEEFLQIPVGQSVRSAGTNALRSK